MAPSYPEMTSMKKAIPERIRTARAEEIKKALNLLSREAYSAITRDRLEEELRSLLNLCEHLNYLLTDYHYEVEDAIERYGDDNDEVESIELAQRTPMETLDEDDEEKASGDSHSSGI